MILCADDYGLSEDIDAAIVELAAAGHISAASCLVALDRCGSAAMAVLRAHEEKLDLGLHLCLTGEGLPLSALPDWPEAPRTLPPYRNLLARALCGRLPRRELALQVAGQYAVFVERCGRGPDFIDGHLHVHQLPGVREALLDFVLGLPAGQRLYIRNTRQPLRSLWRRRLPWFKAVFIGIFGAGMFKRLRAPGVPTNDGFAGIYDFRDWRRYREYLPRFAACVARPNGLLVVHPGGRSEWRRQELAALRDGPFAPGTLNRFRH